MTHKQYRVDADIQFQEDAFHNLKSEWHHDRDRAVKTMQKLRQAGHLAEIQIREIQTEAKAGEVPE